MSALRPSLVLLLASVASAAAQSGADALTRVCMLRVEFIEDYTDSTTGTGLFLPEHGRDYSLDVAEQLDSYFTDVSRDRQDFEFSVFPAVGGGGYTMPHQMSWYGDGDRWPTAVMWLLVHAVQAADPEVDFSEYDVVMVVHAGVGSESNPSGPMWDLPSMFVDAGSFSYYIGQEDPWMAGGIPTNDGMLVSEGIIVPEHQTQNTYGLGVLGVSANKLLRWLGAPDLYNTSTGSIAIGGWDIMGYGQWIMDGFWPSAPGAYTRENLGWADVVEVWNGSFTVAPNDTVYRVPLSGTEYLLIENRQRDPDGDGQCGAHERDYGLPGSGVLIWHIDETRLGSHILNNTVNADPLHQGVTVVEADGIPDFNSPYYDYFYTSDGSQWDPWKRDGYAWLLGPATTPSTSASWGGRTGVTVDVTSNSGNSMTFTVAREGVEGWPAEVQNPASGPVVWNAPGLGEVIAVLRGSGRIALLSPEGETLAGFGTMLATPPRAALLADDEYLLTGDRNGFVHMLTPEWGVEAPGWPARVSEEPVQVLFSEELQIAAAAAGDSVYLFASDGEAIPGWPHGFEYSVQGICVTPDVEVPGIAVTVADGSLFAFDLDGHPLFADGSVHPGGGDISVPISADFDRDGVTEIALTSRGYVWCYDTEGNIEPGFPAELSGEALGGVFPSDLDGNGYLEVVVETSTGACAVTASGTILADWPVSTPTDSLVSEIGPFQRRGGWHRFRRPVPSRRPDWALECRW